MLIPSDSRRLIWLNVYTTNNDPKIIAGYFYEALCSHSGCPKIVRADAGTENIHIKDIQEALMNNRQNEHNTSYIEGSSTSNQRIEVFWCNLRKQCMQYWIDLFSTLEEDGQFLGDLIDKNIAQFCFMGLIQV